MNTMSTTG